MNDGDPTRGPVQQIPKNALERGVDVIVIGAGVNGLAAAIRLAQANKKVLVVEQSASLGGVAAGREFHPGYRTAGTLHDTCLVDRSLISTLAVRGLRWRPRAKTIASAQQGASLRIDHVAGRIDAADGTPLTPDDLRAFADYRRLIAKLRPIVFAVARRAPPDPIWGSRRDIIQLGRLALSLRSLGKKHLRELIGIAPMSLADMLGDRFASEALIGAMAGYALGGAATGPRGAHTVASLLWHDCRAGAQEIVGGPAALVDALTKAATRAGVPIVTGACATAIVTARDKSGLGTRTKVEAVTLGNQGTIACKHVAASCDVRQIFFDLIAPRARPAAVSTRVKHIRSRGSLATIDLALSHVPSIAGWHHDVARVTTARSVENLQRAFDGFKYNELPNTPWLDIALPSKDDPTLCPAGHAVMSINAQWVPFRPRDGWTDDARAHLVDCTLTQLDSVFPSIRDHIIAHDLRTPEDLSRDLALPDGHVFHGEHAPDQLLFMRPVAGLSGYRTPIRGLFLCGSGCHPGGGISATAGVLGAEALLANASTDRR